MAFLRLWPTVPRGELGHVQLLDMVKGNLRPLGSTAATGWDFARNKYGAFAYWWLQKDESEISDDLPVVGLSEAFKTGELWGIDARLLSIPDPRSDEPFIPITLLQQDYVEALTNYLDFAKNQLKLDLPLEGRAGLVGVTNYRLAGLRDVFPEPLVGHIYDNTITDGFQIMSYGTAAEEVLRPFFRKIFDSAGVNWSEE